MSHSQSHTSLTLTMTITTVYLYYGVIFPVSKLRLLFPDDEDPTDDPCYRLKVNDLTIQYLTHDLLKAYNDYLPQLPTEEQVRKQIEEYTTNANANSDNEEHSDPELARDCVVIGVQIASMDTDRHYGSRDKSHVSIDNLLFATAPSRFASESTVDLLKHCGKPGYFMITDDCICCS